LFSSFIFLLLRSPPLHSTLFPYTTLFRYLGCPIDLDFDPKQPERRGKGWMLDDQRPTLTLTYPQPGVNKSLTKILIGMHDYDTRSEEHTSELQSRFDLVCRLLLEKKKHKK